MTLTTLQKLEVLTKDEKETLAFIDECECGSYLETSVTDVIEALQELHEKLYGHRVEAVDYLRLAQCKDYYYKQGYNGWEDEPLTFIDSIYEILHNFLPHNSPEAMQSMVVEIFGEHFFDVCSSKESDLFEVRICDTILQMKPVSDEISTFTLIELDGDDTQVIHCDWMDDEILAELASSINTYLASK